MPRRKFKVGDVVVIRGYLPFRAEKLIANLVLYPLTGYLGEVIGSSPWGEVQVRISVTYPLFSTDCWGIELEYLGEL